jgi:hypothetical protein
MSSAKLLAEAFDALEKYGVTELNKQRELSILEEYLKDK